jgi:hypothetical protein
MFKSFILKALEKKSTPYMFLNQISFDVVINSLNEIDAFLEIVESFKNVVKLLSLKSRQW